MKIIYILLFILNITFAYDIKTFSANFIQTIKSNNSTIKYKGQCFITQDNALWNYDFPSKKQIYINKKEAIIIEYDLEQATKTKLDEVPNLNDILKNTKQIDENKLQAEYKNIKYNILLENNLIKQINYKDDLDNEVCIIFSNQKKDEKINDGIFSVKIPKNFDLIF